MLDHSSQGRRFIWIKGFKSLKRFRRYFPNGNNPFEVDNQQKSAFIRRDNKYFLHFCLKTTLWSKDDIFIGTTSKKNIREDDILYNLYPAK